MSRTVTRCRHPAPGRLRAWEGHGRIKAQTLHDRVLEAPTAAVPDIVAAMPSYRRWLNPLLQKTYLQAEHDNDRHRQLHASLALLPVDPKQDYLCDRLLEAPAAGSGRHSLGIAALPCRADLALLVGVLGTTRPRTWTSAVPRPAPGRDYPGSSPLGGSQRRRGRPPGQPGCQFLGTWSAALQPVGSVLLPALASFLEDEKRQGPEIAVMAGVIAPWRRKPDAYGPPGAGAARAGRGRARDDVRMSRTKKQVNAGVALVAVGRGDKVWPLLRHTPTRRCAAT